MWHSIDKILARLDKLDREGLERRAFFLWKRYQTQTFQYDEVAKRLGWTRQALNRFCHDRWNEQRKAKR